jgi:hypothetical protein
VQRTAGLQPLRRALPGAWIDIHGTIGVLLWPIALVFGLYALTAGRSRLGQPANLLALLALALAVGSGKWMQEDWLRDRELDHLVYTVHLMAWLAIALAALIHVLAVLRRGGWPLARSMASLSLRSNDLPGHWPAQMFGAIRRRP